jgi:hypothetical protein
VLHRLYWKWVRNGVPVLRTRGDCVFRFDPPIAAEDLLGRVSHLAHGVPLRGPALWLFSRALWVHSVWVYALVLLTTGPLRPLVSKRAHDAVRSWSFEVAYQAFYWIFNGLRFVLVRRSG